MLAFSCPVCAHLVTFESTRCLSCTSPLAYEQESRRLWRLGDAGMVETPPVHPADRALPELLCANAEQIRCNWLAREPGEFCRSCALTRTRPAGTDVEGLRGWAQAEAAKRWLLFGLLDLGLPVQGTVERAGGLAFDLLSSSGEPVTTGHADGVVTLDLAETDPARRQARRAELGEPYRTVLGHLRHEIGHYYQPLLVPDGSPLEGPMRELFGDEREDYGEALKAHYERGAPRDWQDSHVSAYATMHPWEDWAETFAHYLHIRDTLQSAAAYGLRVAGPRLMLADTAPLHSVPAAAERGTEDPLEAWIPLTIALNQISRSMGQPDTYPFVLAPAVLEKLRFIGAVIEGRPPAPVRS